MSVTKNRKRKNSNDNVPNEDPDEELNWSDEEGTTVDGIYIPPPIKRHTNFTSETRLIIKKISNNFFKSYAHETDLGPFTKVCIAQFTTEVTNETFVVF